MATSTIKSGLFTASVTDTTSSTGWVLLKLNSANVSINTYDVVSAYVNGKVCIPFASGNIWYVKVCEYVTMSATASEQVTVNFTARRK